MSESERKLSNMQIITLAVSELGGVTKDVDIEDIAIRAYEMAPDKFSWRKYPDRIDLRSVQYALKDAISSQKESPLVKGSIKHGYMLTPAGLEWIQTNLDILAEKLEDQTSKQSITDKLSIEQARLLTSKAYSNSYFA